jgi:hypothetical protein
VIDYDGLLAQACELAGLDDFGDQRFLQPLFELVHSINEEARLSPAGMIGAEQRLLSNLVTRLNVEASFNRNPEIEDESVDVAAVIVGLPRTGTTMLHRVLSSDPQFLFPTFYESRFPSAPLDWDYSGEDPRVSWIEAEIKAILDASPELASVHPWQAKGAEEEVMMLENSFFSTVPEAYYRVPRYSQWLEQHDNRPGYEYLERMLKLLQWQKRKAGSTATRWLLKTPHHLHHMDILLSVFPGAKIIQTHRDPLQTIPSLVSFNRYLFGLGSEQVDLPELAKHWSAKFAAGMRKTLAVRDKQPERFIDVDFRDTVRDPQQVIESIYSAIGLQLTDQARQAMDQWRQDNPRDARPPHEYTMDEFGFTEQQLADQFKEYRQRYVD